MTHLSGWAVLQLSAEADDLEGDDVGRLLARWFDAEVRIVEGYALVRQPRATRLAIEHQRLVERLLRLANGDVVVLSDAEVRRLTRGRFRRGASVQILSGPLEGMTGRVTSAHGDRLEVRVTLRSTHVLVPLTASQVAYAPKG
ncbi:MAG: KOW motif-containing protein [Labilithrix sp.]|nr:KOW motif-containing protein [Labilithrix sp.]